MCIRDRLSAWQVVDKQNLAATTIIGFACALYLIIYLLSHKPRQPLPEELQYQTINASGKIITRTLPTLMEMKEKKLDSDVILSVVIPSYNETARIKSMLSESIKYLDESIHKRWEILIVDDGSSDGTSEYCLKLAHEKFHLHNGELRVLKFFQNRGKGGAVREGMLHVRGKYTLFADADGASKFSDVEKLMASVQNMERIKEGTNTYPAIALGSRAHMVNTEAVSYTHLDVYKRQVYVISGADNKISGVSRAVFVDTVCLLVFGRVLL